MSADRPLLVTGAGGQVGRALLAEARRRDLAVIALDRRALDLTSPSEVARTLAALRPRAVLNAAAYTDVDRAEAEPCRAWAVNAAGPKHLAEACARIGAPLVHFSTDYVFDGSARRPYREDDPPRPLNAYGRSKWEGEEAVRAALPAHLILRTSWVFAPEGSPFVRAVARAARAGQEVRGADDQWGSPTPARALAAIALTALAKARKAKQWGTYHAAGVPPASRYHFACAIVAALRVREGVSCPPVVPVPASAFPAAAVRPAYSALDSTLLHKTFGVNAPSWEPELRCGRWNRTEEAR